MSYDGSSLKPRAESRRSSVASASVQLVESAKRFLHFVVFNGVMPKVLVGADIHGAYEELASQVNPDDILVLCGDYLNFFDYETREGLIAKLIPKETIIEVLKALGEGRTEESKRMVGEIVSGNPNLAQDMVELVHEAYERMFSLLRCKTYLTFGNVDYPDILKEHVGANHVFVDGDVVEIAGELFGFVGGLPPTTYTFGLPGEIDETSFVRKLDEIGKVDVLVTHCPPAIPDLTFDTLANRDEEGNALLKRFVEDFSPKTHYFGHVHQPRRFELSYFGVRLVNVGYFKRTKRLLVHKEF